MIRVSKIVTYNESLGNLSLLFVIVYSLNHDNIFYLLPRAWYRAWKRA